MIQFDEHIFSDGLVQPPTTVDYITIFIKNNKIQKYIILIYYS